MTELTPCNPSFQPPDDDSDREVWLLRVPAALDAHALLDGLELDLDPSGGDVVCRFERDGRGYALTAGGDGAGSDDLRLLAPADGEEGEDDGRLVARRPFARHLCLASDELCEGAGGGPGPGVPSEATLAPSWEDAPAPVVDGSGKNGSVDAVRVAYARVPQRVGLRRRWTMPGGGAKGGALAAVEPARTTAGGRGGATPRGRNENRARKIGLEGDGPPPTTPKATPDDEVVSAPSSKKRKKEKKKKEKKGKKSSKK